MLQINRVFITIHALVVLVIVFFVNITVSHATKALNCFRKSMFLKTDFFNSVYFYSAPHLNKTSKSVLKISLGFGIWCSVRHFHIQVWFRSALASWLLAIQSIHISKCVRSKMGCECRFMSLLFSTMSPRESKGNKWKNTKAAYFFCWICEQLFLHHLAIDQSCAKTLTFPPRLNSTWVLSGQTMLKASCERPLSTCLFLYIPIAFSCGTLQNSPDRRFDLLFEFSQPRPSLKQEKRKEKQACALALSLGHGVLIDRFHFLWSLGCL